MPQKHLAKNKPFKIRFDLYFLSINFPFSSIFFWRPGLCNVYFLMQLGIPVQLPPPRRASECCSRCGCNSDVLYRIQTLINLQRLLIALLWLLHLRDLRLEKPPPPIFPARLSIFPLFYLFIFFVVTKKISHPFWHVFFFVTKTKRKFFFFWLPVSDIFVGFFFYIIWWVRFSFSFPLVFFMFLVLA